MDVQNDLCIPVSKDESKQEHDQVFIEEGFDYSQRGQRLHAGLLGANDGVGAVRQDVRAMNPTGFAGLVAGACSMAISEFVSVYSQRYVEVAQMKRETMTVGNEKSFHLYGSNYFMFYLL
ncbi:hypothetical protein L2E82_01779 [Cichorium intybus]|uniref:Uncharacterized protein n=1 Tax=Cichorium intybus TaxID=13427 RepID=A0ACB9H0W8_CICIN|nr:hypothetical protein L2E82_01779 [Cichorium intybus]